MPDLESNACPMLVKTVSKLGSAEMLRNSLANSETSVVRSIKTSDHRKPPRLDLLEVMFSEQSEFTKPGSQARR